MNLPRGFDLWTSSLWKRDEKANQTLYTKVRTIRVYSVEQGSATF